MPMYEVQIRYAVNAPNADAAEKLAHNVFPFWEDELLQSQDCPKVIREIPPEEAKEYEAVN